MKEAGSRRRIKIWVLWVGITLLIGLLLGRKLKDEKADKSVFLPGKTTNGHYQIELRCEACHSEDFSGTDVLQAACVKCHGKDLEDAHDSHPESKFTDPRNAKRVAKLDARHCITCHSEHQPERTSTMGLSLPTDYCYQCHQDIATDRPSHVGLPFDSCADSGCHNFHDNRALYEDYLVRHADELPLLSQPLRPLQSTEAECPSPARKGVSDATPLSTCETCHAAVVGSFTEGRHGMRLAQGFAPMRVRDSRLPMKAAAGDRQMTCAACHGEKRDVSLVQSEVETCLGCHDDGHSRAYKDSAHYALLEKEITQKVARGSGVTCATCHVVRAEDEDGNVFVNHNQNHNLRPADKMIRSVCGDCHGLRLSVDALADEELLRKNFTGAPKSQVKSIDFALSRQ